MPWGDELGPWGEPNHDAALGALADDAGISLVAMAFAFVMQHPAVTAPIIGPRALESIVELARANPRNVPRP